MWYGAFCIVFTIHISSQPFRIRSMCVCVTQALNGFLKGFSLFVLDTPNEVCGFFYQHTMNVSKS